MGWILSNFWCKSIHVSKSNILPKVFTFQNSIFCQKYSGFKIQYFATCIAGLQVTSFHPSHQILFHFFTSLVVKDQSVKFCLRLRDMGFCFYQVLSFVAFPSSSLGFWCLRGIMATFDNIICGIPLILFELFVFAWYYGNI